MGLSITSSSLFLLFYVLLFVLLLPLSAFGGVFKRHIKLSPIESSLLTFLPNLLLHSNQPRRLQHHPPEIRIGSYPQSHRPHPTHTSKDCPSYQLHSRRKYAQDYTPTIPEMQPPLLTPRI